jgi:hypothetical protein
MRSRRRIFRRKKASPMRLLGVLTLVFAGSFAAAIVTTDWQDSLPTETRQGLSGKALAGADGLLARTPAMRIAASSTGLPLPDRR